MLQKITEGKKKSWLRLCTLYGVNKWDLVDYTNELVYASRYLIKTGLEVKTKR